MRLFFGYCLTASIGALAFACNAVAAETKNFPNKPLTILVPYPAGGLADTVSRVIADKVGQQTGQSVVVENRAGAGGQIGLQSMLRQPKDGYVVSLVVPATMITLPLTNKNYKINPQLELEPITVAVDTYLTMVVNSKLPVNTLKDFMGYAQKNENTISYGTPGLGTSFHFNNVVLAEKLGINPLHVPYTGELSILNDIAGNRVTYALVSNAARNFIESDEVKPLAITAEQRVQVIPEVATFKELGVDFKTDGWVGYAVSKGTPSDIVEKLNTIFVKAIKDPEVEQKLIAMGYSTVANSPADFNDLLEKSRERYINMIESGRIKLD